MAHENYIMLKSLPSKLSRLVRIGSSPRKPVDVEVVARQNPPQTKFVPLLESPHPALRKLYADITKYSSCPECLHLDDFLPEEEWDDHRSVPGGSVRIGPGKKSVLRPEFACPNCGFPTHCGEDHWKADTNVHASVCNQLRQWSIEEHDLRSGRKFWENTFPGRQDKESYLNFSSWPYIFTTRKFPKPVLKNTMVQKHLSRTLTYPYTIASILFNPWIYAEEEAVVTNAGWHLLSSLSHSVEYGVKSAMSFYHQNKGPKNKFAFTEEPTSPSLTGDPMRIFILGPRVESQLPPFVWEQLSMCFPGVPFRVYFVGPEANPPRFATSSNAGRFSRFMGRTPASSLHSVTRKYQRPVSSAVSKSESEVTVSSTVLPVSVNLRLEYIPSMYDEVHESFGPFKRNRDVFVLFNSGLGNENNVESWRQSIKEILKTRCLTVFTSANKVDQENDVEAIKTGFEGEYVVALRPTFNKFSSMRPDFSADVVHDPDQWIYNNWGLFAIHGIGKDMDERGDETQYQLNPVPEEGKWWTW